VRKHLAKMLEHKNGSMMFKDDTNYRFFLDSGIEDNNCLDGVFQKAYGDGWITILCNSDDGPTDGEVHLDLRRVIVCWEWPELSNGKSEPDMTDILRFNPAGSSLNATPCVVCPVCPDNYNYVSISEIETVSRNDNAARLGKYETRGTAHIIHFECEVGHKFKAVFAYHKGQTQHTIIPSGEK
jgi:hypothetical protein